MEYVLLAQHTPEACPSSNAKTRQRMQAMTNEKVGALASKHSVLPRLSYILGLSHRLIIIAQAPNVEAVRDFAVEMGLAQWNTVDIYPAWTMEEAAQVTNALEPLDW